MPTLLKYGTETREYHREHRGVVKDVQAGYKGKKTKSYLNQGGPSILYTSFIRVEMWADAHSHSSLIHNKIKP